MKTRLTILFVSLLFIAACGKSGDKGDNSSDSNDDTTASSDNGNYRYNLKSAIITSNTKTDMMGTDITTILTFDDHGEKTATETVSKISVMGQNMETHNKSIMKDGYIYSWQTDQKTGTKMKIDMNSVENMDYKKMSEDMMKQMNIKKAGNATVMGKSCDVYEMNNNGMTGKYYIWDNIAMKMETSMSGMNMVIEVTDIRENPSVPASTFDVPSDVTFAEMTMPTRAN